ncbi:MAG: hypothetical protein JWQ02_1040, partial [Capsulimonas sp.]|nr:hypothetical protein [Capsulimonas sp.]
MMQTSNNDIDVRQMLKPTRSDIALVLAKAGLQELPGGGVVASL